MRLEQPSQPCALCRAPVVAGALHACDGCERETCAECVARWDGDGAGACTACADVDGTKAGPAVSAAPEPIR